MKRIIKSRVLSLLWAVMVSTIMMITMATPAFAVEQDDEGGDVSANGPGTLVNKFAKNMDLQTVYIDRSKFYSAGAGNAGQSLGNTFTLNVAEGLNVKQQDTGDVVISGKWGTTNQVKSFTGQTWTYTYKEAAIFPDGSKGDVVMTYTLDSIVLAGKGTNAGNIGKEATILGLTQNGVKLFANIQGLAAGNNGNNTKVGYRFYITLKVSVTNGSGTFLLPVSGVNAGKSKNTGNGAAFECFENVNDLSDDDKNDLRRERAEVNSGTIYAPSNSDIKNFDGNTVWGGNNVRPASTSDNSGRDRNYNSGFVVEANDQSTIQFSTMAGKATGNNGVQPNTIFVEMGDLQHRIWSGSGPHGTINTGKTGKDTDLAGGSFTGAVPSGFPTGKDDLKRYVVPDAKEGVTYTMTPKKGYTLDTLTVDNTKFTAPENSELVPGKKWTINSTDGSGTLTYVGGGKFTYSFDKPNTQDHEIYVTWKKETADIIVNKVWNDDSKAAAAKVKLVSDAEVDPVNDQQDIPLTSGEVHKWTGMPVYNYDGNGDATTAIKYTLSEINDPVSNDYIKGVWSGADYDSGTADGGFTLTDPNNDNGIRETNDPFKATVTNTLKKDVEITKEWVDQNNKFNTRPDDVAGMFKLYNAADDTEVTGVTPTATASGDNAHKVTWSDLPALDTDGNKITYYAKETTPAGYTSDPADGKVSENGTITNTLQTKDVEITKEWADQSNKYNTRPSDVAGMFKLYSDEACTTEVTGVTPAATASGDNAHTVKWTGLPAYDTDGNEITYYAKETAPTGYTSDPSDGKVAENGTITNTLQTKNVVITKKWKDPDDSKRPAPEDMTGSFTLYNKSTGAKVDGVTPAITASGSDYIVTWSGLLKFDPSSGDEILYQAEETKVPDGYEIIEGAGKEDEDGKIVNSLTKKDTRKITRTVKYTYITIDGKTAHEDVVQELPLERTSHYDPDDPSADADGWVWGDWEYPKGKTFPAVKNPNIKGWKTSDVAGPYTITGPDDVPPTVHIVYQKSNDPGTKDKDSKGEKSSSGTRTGDRAMPYLFGAIMLLAVTVIAITLIRRRRNQ